MCPTVQSTKTGFHTWSIGRAQFQKQTVLWHIKICLKNTDVTSKSTNKKYYHGNCIYQWLFLQGHRDKYFFWLTTYATQITLVLCQ